MPRGYNRSYYGDAWCSRLPSQLGAFYLTPDLLVVCLVSYYFAQLILDDKS